MKVTVEWLKDFIRTDADANEIGATLTMLGLELEAIEESPLGPVLDFKVTPNRGDCLSVLGLARELSAKDAQKYAPTELLVRLVGPVGSVQGDNIVQIEDPDLCPRYAAGVFRSVKVGPSPSAMQARVSACGMRPINIIVDTTNYVMLEIGQPLHAFDMPKLAGQRIVVRRAKTGEKMTTLDGVERNLRDDMLMICDADKPVAIAGVMGGENSEVSNTTTEVLLESAHFDAVSVRRTRRALGMSTEASYRFERFVDPDGVVRAINRVGELLGLQPDSICDSYPLPTTPTSIKAREERWNALLGVTVPRAAAAVSLTALGMSVKETDAALEVQPPSWRNDLQLEEDLVEEIGRVWGYEKIPEALPFGSTTLGGESEAAAFRTQVRQSMLRLGFTEVLTHTLRDRSALDPNVKPIELRNPGAPELALLRPSLLSGIAAVAARSRSASLAFFEVGRVFGNGSESRSLGILLQGKLSPDHWKAGDSAAADFFAMKGAVEELASLLRRQVSCKPSDDKRFHPTRQAAIEGIGVFGEVLPAIGEQLDLQPGTLMAELNLDALQAMESWQPQYEPLSHFPAVRRDLAFVVAKQTPYAELENAVREAAGEVLEDAWLFDVYEGKGIEPGHHSIGIAIILRHSSRTLTDEEANEARERAFLALEKFGAKRRS